MPLTSVCQIGYLRTLPSNAPVVYGGHAVAVLLPAGKVDAHGAVTAVALSSDHTPMDAKEAERIIATGVSGLAWQGDRLITRHHLSSSTCWVASV
jgi:hypothetical protein